MVYTSRSARTPSTAVSQTEGVACPSQPWTVAIQGCGMGTCKGFGGLPPRLRLTPARSGVNKAANAPTTTRMTMPTPTKNSLTMDVPPLCGPLYGTTRWAVNSPVVSWLDDVARVDGARRAVVRAHQERALGVDVDGHALDHSGRALHAHLPAKGIQAVTPLLDDRIGRTFRCVDVLLQRSQEPDKQWLARQRCAGAGGEAGGGGQRGRCVHIEANPHHRSLVVAHLVQFDQNAADLGTVHEHVIGPFESAARGHDVVHDVADGQGCSWRQGVKAPAGRRPQAHREGEAGARDRDPLAAEAPASPRLIVGHHHGAVGSTQ